MVGNKIQIVIVDDHPAVLFGLEAILKTQEDFEVVGLAEDGLQAIYMCEQQHPNVVLMDLNIPRINGIEATRQVRKAFPDTQVLILTASENDQDVFEALEAGAIGYLVKNAGVKEMASAIRAAHSGKRSLSPEALEGLIRIKTSHDLSPEPLTEREQEVLALIKNGLSNPQIAAKLSLSVSTVKFHIGSLYKKLNVSSRAEAVSKAFERNLVHR